MCDDLKFKHSFTSILLGRIGSCKRNFVYGFYGTSTHCVLNGILRRGDLVL